jgi:hypothetical protein
MTTFTTEDRLNAETLREIAASLFNTDKLTKKQQKQCNPNQTPYTTSTGIQIGKYYQKPKYVEQDPDMLRLQSYLIYDPNILKKQYWFGIAYKVALGFILLILILVNK